MEECEPLQGLDCGRDHDLTIAEIKACDIFSHFSDEDAQEVIETLKRLSIIIFNCYQKEHQSLVKNREIS